MRILVAPQEFKGTLTAAEAAAAIRDGLRAALPDAVVETLPLSDGGPGLVDVLLAARGGQRMETAAHDPLMRPVTAAWGLLDSGVAVIEMAAASGLVLVAPIERDALRATTYGTGELIRSALDRGCREIIVGVGGSATTDAGAGAMQALGAHLLDADGDELPRGGTALADLAGIDLTDVDRRLAPARVRVASDVTNALCGPTGAARMYGPQKGASPEDVEALERSLRRFAEVARRQLSIDLVNVEGGGAAGGLGCGLIVAAGATIERGFDLVAEAVGLDEQISHVDLVITGEGRLDAQTVYGKTAAGVARRARALGKRVIAIAGSIEEGADVSMFDAAAVCVEPGAEAPQTRDQAVESLMRAVVKVATGLSAGDQAGAPDQRSG